MNIEISKIHGLNFGEDLEYIQTYIKGKNKGKLTEVERYRILFLEGRENFFGRKKSFMIESVDEFQHISPDQIKNRNYNYYKFGYDLNTVDEFFTAYINSDPMIHVGGFQHSFVSGIKNYTWTYKFNGKSY